MPSLPNYLQTNRKRTSLSQEEVAFLLGITGMNKGGKVSRDEQAARIPTLETALAYELIYGRPIQKLFAGLYEEMAVKVSARAKTLGYRSDIKLDQKKSHTLADLALGSSRSVA